MSTSEPAPPSGPPAYSVGSAPSSDPSQAGRLPYIGVSSEDVREVRLLKVTSKRDRRKPWRWDVTTFRTAQTINPGVYDGRIHLGGPFGYARTRRAALRQIGKALR